MVLSGPMAKTDCTVAVASALGRIQVGCDSLCLFNVSGPAVVLTYDVYAESGDLDSAPLELVPERGGVTQFSGAGWGCR